MNDLEKELLELEKNEKAVKKHLKSKNYSKRLFPKIVKKLDKYNPQVKLLDNIRFKGNKVMRIKISKDKYEHAISRNKVQSIGNDLSHYLQKKGANGSIMTSLRMDDIGQWRSGYWADIGDDIRLYQHHDSDVNLEDPKEFKSFVFYVLLKPRNAGGSDKYNDCLYNCLKSMLYNRLPWNTPWDLKKYLKLQRNDKISIDLVPKIEEKLKTFAINVRGDYIYTSTIQSNKIINLVLTNEHYSIDKSVNNKKHPLFNTAFTEKEIVLYDKQTFEIYDGVSKRVISKQERFDMRNHKSQYILIDREEQKDNKLITIEEEYIKLIEIADILKKESNGYINLRKTGNIHNTAMDLFDRFTKFIMNPEQIQQDEAVWIQEASTGAIIWAEEYSGPAYCYDVKSMYPSILKSTQKFPIARGEFEKLDSIDNLEFYPFGIYRCKILKSGNINVDKLFRFNDKNKYTHISLEHAKKLNLKIELIQDSQPNCLRYSREKLISFEEVFGQYVNFLFDLKQKKVPKDKDILNILWGACCEYNKKKYFCDDKIIELDCEDEILNLRPYKFNEEVDILETVSRTSYFKTNFARLGPFLISRGRNLISNIISPYADKIHRIHMFRQLTT